MTAKKLTYRIKGDPNEVQRDEEFLGLGYRDFSLFAVCRDVR